MIDILQSLYNDTKCTLENLSFLTTSGVRQGGPESPPLFNLYVDFVMRIFMDTCSKQGVDFLDLLYDVPIPASTESSDGTKMSKKCSLTLPWIGYADDIVLFLRSVPGLQKCLDILVTIFSRFALKVNVSKTETQIINLPTTSDIPSSLIQLDAVDINNTAIFKYLGAQISTTEAGTGWTEVNYRIQNAKCQFFQKKNLFLNHAISIKTRVNFLNSFVRSRLTYACQNWALTKLQLNKLNSTYSTFLRKMIRNGFRRQAPNPDGSPNYKFHYTNDSLYSICSTPMLSTFIEKSQLKYCAHIIRQQNSSLCKALMFNADKYSKRGQPNPTLLSQVLKCHPNMSPSDLYAKSLQRCM